MTIKNKAGRGAMMMGSDDDDDANDQIRTNSREPCLLCCVFS